MFKSELKFRSIFIQVFRV